MTLWLTENAAFPPVTDALSNGLLAAGGELSPARILAAYRLGIFPWFSPGEPVLWWSPDPRMVLMPAELKISRSFSKVLRNSPCKVRTDTAFEQVMRACAAPREGQSGTWIDEQMIDAYCALHKLGFAHSVEIWLNDELVGGLYGVAIGRMFYGESMFSLISNASKIALAHLARKMGQCGTASPMIDCQMYTPHLATMGARRMPREEFIARLEVLVNCEPVTDWRFDPDLFT